MDVNDEDVAILVHDVWSSMLGMELHEAPTGPLGVVDRSLTGFVHIQGGAWVGAVTVEVPAELAAEAAAAMFGVDVDELGGEEIDDALGELANMVGGGVKSMLPGPCQLSLPTVVGGLDYELNVPGCLPTRQLWFLDARGRSVAVTVLEGDAEAAATVAAPAEAATTDGAELVG